MKTNNFKININKHNKSVIIKEKIDSEDGAMKKIGYMLFILLVFFCSSSVSAMTKEELKAKIRNGFEVNGETIKLESSQIVEVERYLDNNEIKEEDIGFISAKIDEAVDIMEESGVSSISELPSDKEDKIMSLVTEVSEKTDIKVSLSKNSVTIYNSDGTMFTKIDDSVEYTDSFSPLIFTSVLISIIGLSTMSYKVVRKDA